MAILSSELILYKSKTVDDTASNGGRMSSNAIADGVKNNLWADVPQSERVAGSTKYRKAFLKIANAAGLAYQTPKLFIETPTPGDDRVYLFPATQRDTQSGITGSERPYGAGQLNADIIAGAATLDVLCENGADQPFRDGDLIRISDKADVNDTGGNEEYLRLAATGGVSYLGDVATLNLASGTVTLNAYTASASRVAACIEPADISAAYDNKSVSSALGTYDDTTYPVELDNIGTAEETITITFTGATTFDVVGDTLGSLGSGTTGTDFIPNNPDFSKPYFTLRSAGWGGTWATGDTFSFQTHPAAYPFWLKRIVPAGAASLTGDKVIVGFDGESA